MAFVLVHLSDIHLGPLPVMRTRDMFSKRITGYMNWHGNRANHLSADTLRTVTEAVATSGADHIAVTGDLTNLALDAELSAAAVWLTQLGEPDDVSVIPGNHDAYVPGAVARVVKAWKPWMTGDDGRTPSGNADFPFVRVRGPVAIIGASSAVATPPFVASGSFERRQADNLEKALETTGQQGLFRVILIHHPPIRSSRASRNRLYGARLFGDVVRSKGAELILHGHTHLAQRQSIEGRDGLSVPVIGVPAAGQSHGQKLPPGGFNRFSIEKTNSGWACELELWTAPDGPGQPTLSERRALWPPDQKQDHG